MAAASFTVTMPSVFNADLPVAIGGFTAARILSVDIFATLLIRFSGCRTGHQAPLSVGEGPGVRLPVHLVGTFRLEMTGSNAFW